MHLDVEVRQLTAHPRVDAVRGCVALARGPLVYALEQADLPEGAVLEDVRDTVLGLISRHTGQPLERIVADSARDRWFTAEEARDYGFIDHVVASLDDIRPVALPVGLGGSR